MGSDSAPSIVSMAPSASSRASRNSSPIVDLCDQIIAAAIAAHASDVHIEPIIDSAHRRMTIGTLGYEPQAAQRLRRGLGRPEGLVLVTGPPGSGKTTTLYAALGHLRNEGRTIVSVEKPVERLIHGVNQISVRAASGNTVAATLRSVLRQDPDVLMVGDIGDPEVARIVGHAAGTGHLVLTSMHAGDAASAIARLVNLGLESHKVAESLTAIVAQRLVRRLCPSCKVPVVVPTRPHAPLRPVASRMRPGPGCKRCKGSGYVDCVPIAEVFTPTDVTRAAMADGLTALELKAVMKEAGHRSLRDVAMRLVDEGVTSLAEVNRVLADDRRLDGRATGRARVLVVDDDVMTRMLVRVLLQREGYEVLEARNGQEGIEMALCHRPDLLITDLVMPDVDGCETLTALRADSSCASMPVIVLTAQTGPEIERTVLSLGADDYLVKPFDADVLLKRVQGIFVRRTPLALAG